MEAPKYRRIVLKISGEALVGRRPFGIDFDVLRRAAAHIKAVHDWGVQMAVVIGGGNFYRGAEGEGEGVDRITGDYMGMLATVMNALALQSVLERMGVETRLQTALPMGPLAEPFDRREALRHLEEGRIVIFAAGTGHPFFTTDTTAALRAAEIQADALLMAKNQVNGIYERDPRRDPSARKFEVMDYDLLLQLDLKVMDPAAVALSREAGIPIIVFNFEEMENLRRAVLGEPVGTIVRRVEA